MVAIMVPGIKGHAHVSNACCGMSIRSGTFHDSTRRTDLGSGERGRLRRGQQITVSVRGRRAVDMHVSLMLVAACRVGQEHATTAHAALIVGRGREGRFGGGSRSPFQCEEGGRWWRSWSRA